MIDNHGAWNAGGNLGAKRPLKPQQIWAIRFLLDRDKRLRDRALFDLAIEKKLRGCDLVKVRIGVLVSGGCIRNRATVSKQKTRRPVQFEMLERRGPSLLWMWGLEVVLNVRSISWLEPYGPLGQSR